MDNNVYFSKTVKDYLGTFGDLGTEFLDIMLNLNSKHNLYNGSNFSYEYDRTDKTAYLIDSQNNTLSCGITTSLDFYDGFSIHFIVLDNGKDYVAITDTEFIDL